jgi:hypothetical protein
MEGSSLFTLVQHQALQLQAEELAEHSQQDSHNQQDTARSQHTHLARLELAVNASNYYNKHVCTGYPGHFGSDINPPSGKTENLQTDLIGG